MDKPHTHQIQIVELDETGDYLVMLPNNRVFLESDKKKAEKLCQEYMRLHGEQHPIHWRKL